LYVPDELWLPAAIGFLLFGGWLFQFVGKTFFPASERTQLQVIVDQAAARRAGISSEDIANALNTQLAATT
jgi:multidrug efflux pump subunit AcrB